MNERNKFLLAFLITERWSQRGCYEVLDARNDDSVTCKCNHLTTFAIIGKKNIVVDNVHAEIPLALRLTIFTSFLVALLLIGFTLITYATFR